MIARHFLSDLNPHTLWPAALTGAAKGLDASHPIPDSVWAGCQRAALEVEDIVKSGRIVYGINTGFGRFAECAVDPVQLAELQRNLVLSHAAGVGEETEREVVMAMWLLRLRTLLRGHSGVTVETIQRLMRILQAGILGCVPVRGSVGASGDLAPGAHSALAMMGIGPCTYLDEAGKVQRGDAGEVLGRAGLDAVVLGPKEGLAMINGTHYTTALAIKLWNQTCRLLRVANLTSAISMEATGGTGTVLEPTVLRTHHRETERAGADIRHWLTNSTAHHDARESGRFAQAPYCLRCAPQVHGAVLRELRVAYDTLHGEMDAIGDNPLLFPEEGLVASCGNFHAIYPARVCDSLAAVLANLAVIAERRINMLMDTRLSGLPMFLVPDGGLNSGFMMAHVSAAALASEAKIHAMPASVDSIPTNCDREDHVSMGPGAALKALRVADLVQKVLAIELMSGMQALEMREGREIPLHLRSVRDTVREQVPFLAKDAVLAPMIAACDALLNDGPIIQEQEAAAFVMAPLPER